MNTEITIHVYAGGGDAELTLDTGTTVLDVVETMSLGYPYTYVIHNGVVFTAASSKWRNIELANGDIIHFGVSPEYAVITPVYGAELDALCNQLFWGE